MLKGGQDRLDRTWACVLKIAQDAWGGVTANQGCLLFLSLAPLHHHHLRFSLSQHLPILPLLPLILFSAPHSHKATVALKAKYNRASWISLRFLSALNHFKSLVPRTQSEPRVWKVKPLSEENKHITWSELAWPRSHPRTFLKIRCQVLRFLALFLYLRS